MAGSSLFSFTCYFPRLIWTISIVFLSMLWQFHGLIEYLFEEYGTYSVVIIAMKKGKSTIFLFYCAT